jgi:membrane protein YqaA with SNARE-associated domain
VYLSINKPIKKLYDRLIGLSEHRYIDVLLSVLFFIESIFFPIPIDPLLILACMRKPAKSLYYGMIATVASVLGGITAYYIGAFLWDTLGIKIIDIFSSKKTFDTVCQKYEMYEAWTVLMAGFTPFPYKAITLSAGFCRLPITTFVIYSAISRGARFMLIAGFTKHYGAKVQYYIDHYGTILLILFTVICILSFGSLR